MRKGKQRTTLFVFKSGQNRVTASKKVKLMSPQGWWRHGWTHATSQRDHCQRWTNHLPTKDANARFMIPKTYHERTRSCTKVWMPCRHILRKNLHDSAGWFVQNIFVFLKWSLHQKVRKCLTIPTPEAVKHLHFGGNNSENTQPWKKHSQKVTRPAKA